jgi:carbonic anhydrase
MPNFVKGVVHFQQEVFPHKKDLFERLSLGQSPEALFITCSDSRIETAMITQTDPGELFICRNAGNIVPPHGLATGAMTASIEFAVAVLEVPHIVICGHTECGAMKGALNPDMVASLPHVRDWLGYTRAAVEVVRAVGADLDDRARMQLLTEQNVVLQLNHLRTHPSVAVALAKKALTLHGWVYDIKTGMVTAWDEQQERFLPVQERYVAELAAQVAGSQEGCAA